MRHLLIVLRTRAEPEQRVSLSAATAGGSRADLVSLPGAPAAALRLEPYAAGIVVEACATGVRAAGRPLHPGARRLLRTGEEVEVGGSRIRVAPAPALDGTRVAAAALVRAAAAASAEVAVAGPHLVVLTGVEAGTRHALAAEQILGRGRSATIRVADLQSSRRHARLRLGACGASIEDLGSKNGLRVNGVAVERRPCPLQDGDELTVGETTLALVDPDARASAAPPQASVAAPRPGRFPRPHVTAAALLGLCAAALVLAS